MTIKAIHFPLGKINNDSLSKIGKEQYKKHVISEITNARNEIILINSKIKREKVSLSYPTMLQG